jgi:carboxyl-terminal processing protease
MLPLATVMRRAKLPFHSDPGALKLTIRKFYRPDGASTQLKGVASDLVLPSTTEVLKVGENEMSDPLPWDRVAPARHDELDRVAPWIAALRDASSARMATNQDFVWLREDNERIKAELANPVVSLNEQKRRQEKAEAEARSKARQKARSDRQSSPETRYEITLRNADQPGLPKPLPISGNSTDIEGPDKGAESATPVSAGKDLAADNALEETEHILLDYITLLNGPKNTTVAQHRVGARAGEASMR